MAASTERPDDFNVEVPDCKTELRQWPKNPRSGVPRRFERCSRVSRWRLDWLAGAAGLEPLHRGICVPLASVLEADRAPHLLGLWHTICCHSLRRTIAEGPIGHASLMRKFESCRPSRQSVSNASHMKVAQKPRVPRFGAGTEIAFETHLQNLAPRAVR